MKRYLMITFLLTVLFTTACQDGAEAVRQIAQVASGVQTALPSQDFQAPPTAVAPDSASEPEAGESTSAAAAGDTSGPAIPTAALLNATYSGIYEEPVTLSDGHFKGEPYAAGDTARPMVEYVLGTELFGDLDGDGSADALVFLREYGGGTAVFTHIAAQLNQDGQPVDAGALSIGSHVQVKSAELVDGQVELEIITLGPDDAECCGTHKMRVSYALQDRALVQTGAQEDQSERVSAADLEGTQWNLLALDFDQPAAPESEVTITFADGLIRGSGGCNEYAASYDLGEDYPLAMAIGLVASTQQACPDPVGSQETAYLAGLEKVSQWGYEFGNLGLYYRGEEDGRLSRLLFAPAGEGAAAGIPLPPAAISNDEGGPERINGAWTYTSPLVLTHFQEPSVALVNVTPYVQGDFSAWVPLDQQFLGRLTGPVAPAPVSYELYVPRRVSGASADLDNDGEEDAGVQIYSLWVASNINDNSYLFQFDQTAYRSYLLDPHTGAFREGTLLLYAPDDAQGFPSGAGEDGIYFTADDPAVSLPAGYTLATLGSDGQVSFDRSAEVTMNTLEEASIASPDFSDQGILESFNSLIDLLAVRYSFTELRGLDWEAIRENYLPQVQAAGEADDIVAYYLALHDLALSLRDAHVYVNAADAAVKGAPAAKLAAEYGANLGAGGVELDDGRYIITFVNDQGPAAEAGWQFGTEIVSVDGVPINEHIDALPQQVSSGNPETIRLQQAALALSFPPGTQTTIEYRQQGEEQLQTAALTAVEGLPTSYSWEEPYGLIEYHELDGGIGYIRWNAFREPLYMLAVWHQFLTEFHGAPGIVIDLRGNGGGNGELLHTMASYFFNEDNPASYHWTDTYIYDDQANDLVKQFAQDYPLYSPQSDLAYGGAVTVLVDQSTASAGEFFPQFLQVHDRAIVVGEHGTAGAGAPVEQVKLPNGITFFFTKGRSYFAGTDELNLEQKGVTLDVRVPITEENEQAKANGGDPVLDAALEALQGEAAQRAGENLAGNSYILLQVFAAPGAPPAPQIPEGYGVTFVDDSMMTIWTDCDEISAAYTLGGGGVITITPETTTLDACPQDSLAEQFVAWLAAANSLQLSDEGLILFTDPASGLFGMALVPPQS